MDNLMKKLDKELSGSVIGTESFYIQNKFYELIEKGNFSDEEIKIMQEKPDLLDTLSTKYIKSDERTALYETFLVDSLNS
ncbi:hypothetical protein [Treponema sp. R6D11]